MEIFLNSVYYIFCRSSIDDWRINLRNHSSSASLSQNLPATFYRQALHPIYLSDIMKSEGMPIKEGDNMTGSEIVNLIHKLEEEGMTADKIIEIIKYVETADPNDPGNR